MSARAEILHPADVAQTASQPIVAPRVADWPPSSGWSASTFAQEQIRNLVRQTFFSPAAHPAKQIVVSGADFAVGRIDLCEQIGRILAAETRASVAVVGCNHRTPEIPPMQVHQTESPSLGRDKDSKLRQMSTQVARNLWLVPDMRLLDATEQSITATSWAPSLAQLRRDFEYSILAAPAAGTSSEAAFMGQLADGIVLVLEAHRTRRASALKIVESFESAQVRVLGVVLNARTFPLPEWLYRRL